MHPSNSWKLKETKLAIDANKKMTDAGTGDKKVEDKKLERIEKKADHELIYGKKLEDRKSDDASNPAGSLPKRTTDTKADEVSVGKSSSS